MRAARRAGMVIDGKLPREGVMRRVLIRAFAVLPVLLVFLPFQATPSPGAVEKPFHMRVLGPDGEAVAGLRVVSDDGIVCTTKADGSVHWTELSIMNRDVTFRISGPNVSTKVRLRPTPGGQSEVTVDQ
jgi:hypothetical protein